jgi:hypothetical protein
MNPCCRCTLFWSVQPLTLLSLPPLPPSPSVSTAFSAHPCNLYLHRCYVLRYYWFSILFFLSLKFHGVVTLLLMCSTYEFVYACFVCMFTFWIYPFWVWLNSHNMMSSNCIHLPPNHVIVPYGRVKLHCVNIPQILDPFISCFHSLANGNSAAVNMGLLYPDLCSLG